jgi:type VI secretion system secreted protein VgrG
MTPLFTLAIDGAQVTWRVVHVSGRERLHAPFVFTVTAATVDSESASEDLIGKHAQLSWATEDGSERLVLGIIDEAARVEAHHELTLVAPGAELADVIDYRVFLEIDALTIATALFKEKNLALESRVQRTIPKRAQCVQSFESTLSFVSRILADEGITWFLDGEKIIAIDHPGFEKLEGSLPVRDEAGMVAGRSVHHARIVRRAASNKVALRDYDFLAPQVDLKADASGTKTDLERYEYPGGFKDGSLGRALAQLRLDEETTHARVLHAASNARGLTPGRIVTLESDRPGLEGDWLLVDVEHEATDSGVVNDGSAYGVRFIAIPAATPHRPARSAPSVLGGVQNATSTGPGGLEIHTEAHARVKALFRWDRRRRRDDQSSAWIRTLQPPTSGAFFLPRVGWEVLVGFVGGSADNPLVLGRLYNGEITPPSALPGNKVVTAFGTLTTPGGGTGNLVQMNDTAGREGMSFVASKDLRERTENDKVLSVSASDSITIGGSRKLIVGQVHQLGIAGSQTHAIGVSRALNVNANMSITAGSETVSIGGARKMTIGGDLTTSCSSLTRLVGAAKSETAIEHQARQVSGASTILVGGAWLAVGAAHASVSVGGVSTELIGGPKTVVAGKYSLNVKGVLNQTFASRSVTAGGAHEEGFGAAAAYTIAGAASMTGANVVFVAKAKLTIKAGGVTITMTPGSIKISGNFKGSVSAIDKGSVKYA